MANNSHARAITKQASSLIEKYVLSSSPCPSVCEPALCPWALVTVGSFPPCALLPAPPSRPFALEDEGIKCGCAGPLTAGLPTFVSWDLLSFKVSNTAARIICEKQRTQVRMGVEGRSGGKWGGMAQASRKMRRVRNTAARGAGARYPLHGACAEFQCFDPIVGHILCLQCSLRPEPAHAAGESGSVCQGAVRHNRTKAGRWAKQERHTGSSCANRRADHAEMPEGTGEGVLTIQTRRCAGCETRSAPPAAH